MAGRLATSPLSASPASPPSCLMLPSWTTLAVLPAFIVAKTRSSSVRPGHRPHLHRHRPWVHPPSFCLAGRHRQLHGQADAGPLRCLSPSLLKVRDNQSCGPVMPGWPPHRRRRLWSVIRILPALLPAAESAKDSLPPGCPPKPPWLATWFPQPPPSPSGLL
jgi:hypothetical protein